MAVAIERESPVEAVNGLRSLPSVDQILSTPQATEWMAEYGRELTLAATRSNLESIRLRFAEKTPLPDRAKLLDQIEYTLREWVAPTLKTVINATGVILHTNLGRAPISKAAMDALEKVASGYSTLEYDLERGKRGSRLVHAEPLIRRITGAEAALVVNNNAAAVLLMLTALARRRSVIIGRSQLIEIGGGFRVPDVMKQSGARLLEVGTTNRVHLADYEAALEESPAMILHAHRSNFRILGFTSEPSLAELAALARRSGVLLVDDLGSGALLDTARFGLGHEPMVQESLSDGADLVSFSGDKLLGGPQSGIVVGSSKLISRLKKHPLARAIRADKLCLAALSETLVHYLKGEAEREIPVWRMIARSQMEIKETALHWSKDVDIGEVIPGESTVGGGSLPGETIPTHLLALLVNKPDRFLACLRGVEPPVIARLENDRVLLDPRTVLPEQEELLLRGLKTAMRDCGLSINSKG